MPKCAWEDRKGETLHGKHVAVVVLISKTEAHLVVIVSIDTHIFGAHESHFSLHGLRVLF